MNTLIRFLAEHLARFIERGSLAGAFVGATVSVLIAWGVAYYMRQADLLDRYWVGAAIALSVVLGLLGAIVGSRTIPDQNGAVTEVPESIVITNLNKTLIYPFVFTGLLVLDVLILRDSAEVQSALKNPALIALVLCTLVFGAATCLVTYCIRVGKEIIFYRLFFPRKHGIDEVFDWGFEVARGKYSHTSPGHSVSFELKLQGRSATRFDVSARQAQALAAILASAKRIVA